MVTDYADYRLRRKIIGLKKLGIAFTAQTPQEINPAKSPNAMINVTVFIDNYVSGAKTEIKIYRLGTTPAWAGDTIAYTTYDQRAQIELNELDLTTDSLWIAFGVSCTATVDVYYTY